MGFMERTMSLRRKEGPVTRKRPEESAATQTMTIKEATMDKDLRRNIQSAHSHAESTWKQSGSTEDTNTRPRTAGRAPTTQAMLASLPPTPPVDKLRTITLPPRSPRMSLAATPGTISQPLTQHVNHSTTAVSSARPQPARSFTTPVNVAQIPSDKDVKPVEAPAPVEPEPSRQEPPVLRKSKSGTWRSFLRRLSKPPVPNFNPADLASAPAVPKLNTKNETSKKLTKDKAVAEKKQKEVETSPYGNPISVDKTRRNRAQVTRSVGSASALSLLHGGNMSSLGLGNSSATQSALDLGMLDVKIPGIEMERYSVMFEKLLEPQESIAERRQTPVKQLEIRGDSPEPVQLQRYATSPNLGGKTSLPDSIDEEETSKVAKPTVVPKNQNTTQQEYRLLRSQTAPPGGLTNANEGKAESTANNSSVCSAGSPVWSEASLPPTPDSDTNSFVSFDINDDDEDDVEIVTCNAVTMHYTPQKHHPRISSAPAIPLKAPGRCSPPAFEKGGVPRKQYQQTPTFSINRPHPPRLSSLDDVSLGQRKRQQPPPPQQQQQTAEPQIGVARRVSVVRRSTAIGTLTVPGSTGNNQTSTPVVDAATPVPVFSRQPLRPKLVDVRNRKSTLVVLDEA